MRKKIGILTFHHVANYGAVLQCYALQTFMQSLGYRTEVVNYVPRRNEDNLYNFFRFRKYRELAEYILTHKRERALRRFRKSKLALSPVKLRTTEEVQKYVKDFDILISGSDQVLNPSTILYGEAYGGKGRPCPTYFLNFLFKGRKIGYALSFGVTQYPEPQLSIAKQYIHSFDKLSVRENTGVSIAESMGRTDAVVVPDPTFLQEAPFYHELANSINLSRTQAYNYCFFIRDIKYTKKKLDALLADKTLLWNNDDGEYSLEGWLNKIKHAEFVVTDSFHCMVMCLKLHTPFAVVTKLQGNVGMNDRFYTILEPLGLEERIICRDNINRVRELLETNRPLPWEEIDTRLNLYGIIGKNYLQDLAPE